MANVWLMGCLVAVVAATQYAGDDLINRDIHALVQDAGQTLPGFTLGFVRQWIVNEGRFFPGALTWTYTVFWFFTSRVAYKIVIGCVVVAATVLFGAYAARVGGHWKVAVLAIPILVAVLQLRVGFDGLTSFAGLVPLVAGMTMASVVILVSRRGVGPALLAACLYAVTLVTYETVLLFAPVMIAVVVWFRRSWRPALAIAVPAALAVALVAFLRLSLDHPPSPAYSMNLDPRTVLLTFGKQALAALPMSQWLLASSAMPAIAAGSLVVGAVAAGIPAFVSVASLGRSPLVVSRAATVAIAGFGAWIWLSSSALVAVTVRWQTDLTRGRGYLPVVFGYLGLGLCLVAAYLAIERIVAARSPARMGAWRLGSALLVAAVAALTLAGNVTVASLA